MSKEKSFILETTKMIYIILKVCGLAPYTLPYSAMHTKPIIRVHHFVQFIAFLCTSTLSAIFVLSVPIIHSLEKSDIFNITLRYVSYSAFCFSVLITSCSVFKHKNWWTFLLDILKMESQVRNILHWKCYKQFCD